MVASCCEASVGFGVGTGSGELNVNVDTVPFDVMFRARMVPSGESSWIIPLPARMRWF